MTDKLHTTDETLIKAARGDAEATLVEVTPTLMADVGRRVKQENDWLDAIEETVAAVPEDQRLAVTAWVMKHLCDHAREGGTFRWLIYERLGFDCGAYVPLFLAGGMDISNCFTLPYEAQREMVDGDL